MYKYIFALLIAFLSLSSLPVQAKDCSGGTITFDRDPSSDMYHWAYGYTSEKNGPVIAMQISITNGMSCDADYIDFLTPQSKMAMKITSGGTCKNSNTITTSYPGIEWQLEGMHCDSGSWLTSDMIKPGERVDWPSGTVLGKAKLIVNDEYWMKNTQTGQHNVTVPVLSIGRTVLNSPSVEVNNALGGSTISFYINDIGTCSMSLIPENIDFGKLTPSDVNRGLYKELLVSYSCKNKALINGLYVRLDPENVVDAVNGMFSANDTNGRKLNFQITRLYGSEQIIPLNTNYQLYSQTQKNIDDSARFRINVKPSTPFPAGKVSTYLNVSLIYR
ncbi:fimbrial protein [Citrobacter amalonaticus]|nr:fimbrial protein [Citrobacter amalonaticus]HBB6760981.1 fimbrial protein [Citrobacter amalonaticus]